MMMKRNVENYTRWIYELAINFHRHLPESSRGWISVEDLVTIGQVQFVYASKRYRQTMNVKFSTFVRLTIERRYIELQRKLLRQKRDALVVSLEDQEIPDYQMLSDPGIPIRVGRFLFLASPDLRKLFAERFFNGGEKRSGHLPKNFPQLVEEARWLAARTSASPDDFRAMRGACVHF